MGTDHPPGERVAQRQRLLFRRDDGLDSLCAGGWQRGAVHRRLDSLPDEVGSARTDGGGEHPHPVSHPVCGRPVGIRPEADGARGCSCYGGGLCAEDGGNRRPGGTNRGRGAADKQLPGQNAQRGRGKGLRAGRRTDASRIQPIAREAGLLLPAPQNNGEKGAVQQGGVPGKREPARALPLGGGTAPRMGF